MGALSVDTTRYLLAKYIPDLQRMEPKNIGVIVWQPEIVVARFIAEKATSLGDVDGRSAPRFVTSLTAYKQWISYWRTQIERAEIDPPPGGKPVPRHSPAFIEALISTSRGNFLLEDAGFALDAVTPDSVSDLADQLYANLVSEAAGDEPRDATLETTCDQIISASGLDNDPHFHRRFPLVVDLAEATVDRLEFSYGYENGTLQRLYQRVPLTGNGTIIRKTVHDSAWMFEKAIQCHGVDRNQTAALVYLTEEQRSDHEVSDLVHVLRYVTRVVEVNDKAAALDEFRSIATSQ